MQGMVQRILFTIMGLFLVSACDKAPPPIEDGGPRPALWEVRNAEGEVEGWLFGTVHALPDDLAWRTRKLDATVAAADLLVVEVANLDDDSAMAGLFRRMAFDAPATSVRSRISPDLRPAFDRLVKDAKASTADLDRMESWAAALALAQFAQDGDEENGVDRILLKAFEARKVTELEGAARQLAIFDQLPEKEQRDLLDAVVVESSAPDEGPDLVDNWVRGDLDRLAQSSERGILADPELRQALLVDRNRAWATELSRILARPEKPLVAVGAGHLLGRDGLPELLQRQGYGVVRVE